MACFGLGMGVENPEADTMKRAPYSPKKVYSHAALAHKQFGSVP